MAEADAKTPVKIEAHAKINVFLRVLGARDDGYHDLESLVLPVTLADTVTVHGATGLKVEVRGDPEKSEAAGAGGMNLALVAALALAETCGSAAGASIEIEKQIPVAAGLGGGSADAAATLFALNELWGCGLDIDELLEVAEKVGSDVPALLMRRPVLMRGRGERVVGVTTMTSWWVVKPFDFPTRSPDAYRWWDEDGSVTGPDPGVLFAAVETGNSELLGSALFNDLEGPVSRRHPEIAEAKEAFLEAGALGAVMSGSGPTVVALAAHMFEADKLAAAVPGSFVVSGPPDDSSMISRPRRAR